MFTVSRSAIAALACIAICSIGCRKPAATEAGAATTTAVGTTAAADPKKPVPETLPDVLARVNGESITKAEFQQQISQMEMAAGQQVPKEQRDEIYRKALDQLINVRVLKLEANTRNLAADDKAVEEQMQKIRSQFPSEEEYTKALSARGMTPEKLRSIMVDESRINKMMEVESAGATAVTDAEIRDFFEKNPDKFKQPEGVRASHVLIRVQAGDEAAQKKALAAIQNVLRQARAGKDFGDLARKYSADSSAQRGGDLGFFTKDRMVPEFSNVAFALKPGQISDIVQTSFGYHVIKVVERRPTINLPLEQVTGQVREFLTQQRKREKAEAFVKVLRSKSRIEVLI